MTDAQIFTVAIAFVVPLATLILGNRRIAEPKETLSAEIAAGFARMSSELQSLRTEMRIHRLKHHR